MLFLLVIVYFVVKPGNITLIIWRVVVLIVISASLRCGIQRGHCVFCRTYSTGFILIADFVDFGILLFKAGQVILWY